MKLSDMLFANAMMGEGGGGGGSSDIPTFTLGDDDPSCDKSFSDCMDLIVNADANGTYPCKLVASGDLFYLIMTISDDDIYVDMGGDASIIYYSDGTLYYNEGGEG